MSSRLTRENFMPSWFMPMPSETEMVVNSRGVRPRPSRVTLDRRRAMPTSTILRASNNLSTIGAPFASAALRRRLALRAPLRQIDDPLGVLGFLDRAHEPSVGGDALQP